MKREEAAALTCGDPEVAIEIILEFVAAVAMLERRVADLERKIALSTVDSSNSSTSRSSDHPRRQEHGHIDLQGAIHQRSPHALASHFLVAVFG